tara:strand:+ start:1536 stop:1670 length:135 start_codon:yes stop_codon:yes gene_type:complete
MSETKDNKEENDVTVNKPTSKPHKAKKDLYDEIVEFYKQNPFDR